MSAAQRDFEDQHRGLSVRRSLTGSGNTIVGRGADSRPVGAFQTEDDARLFAAAPALLAALEAMTLLAEGPTGGVTVAMKLAAIVEARAALAKAGAA